MAREYLLKTVEETYDQAVIVENLDHEISELKRTSSIKYIIKQTAKIFGTTLGLMLVFYLFTVFTENKALDTIASFFGTLFLLSFIAPLIYLTVRKIKRIPLIKEKLSLLSIEFDRLSDMPLVPTDFKNSHDLETIISYFRNHRVDTLKEAINLLMQEYNEERRHREQMDAIDGLREDLQSEMSYMSNEITNVKHKMD